MLRHDKVLASAKLIRDRIKNGEEISEEHQKYYEKALKLFKGTKKEKELTLDS